MSADRLEKGSEIPSDVPQDAPSLRKNGKNWHSRRSAFRPSSGLTSYEARRAKTQASNTTRAREAEMKAEKQQAKDELAARLRERRTKKAEKERWDKMQETVHRKRVERMKRREKRNKLLKS